MRLSHFALALTLILLAVTGYLAWEAQEEARGARRELELVRKQQAAKDAAKPIAPTTVAEIAPLPETPPAVPVAAAPPLMGSGLMPGTPAAPAVAAPAPLTALQKQVLGMPAQAKVIEVQKEQGFAVINAGKNNQLEKGMRYDVRRNDGLVGRVIVSDAIEPSQAVVDIDPTVTLPGVSIEVGDELIVPVRK